MLFCVSVPMKAYRVRDSLIVDSTSTSKVEYRYRSITDQSSDVIYNYINRNVFPVTFEINDSAFVYTHTLDEIIDVIDVINKSEKYNLEYIWLGTSSSMDGPEPNNVQLAKERRSHTVKYICDKTGISEDKIVGEVLGEDWDRMFILLKALDEEYYKKLRCIADRYSNKDNREEEIRRDTTMWNFMKEKILPQCRYAKMLIVARNIEGEVMAVYPVGVDESNENSASDDDDANADLGLIIKKDTLTCNDQAIENLRDDSSRSDLLSQSKIWSVSGKINLAHMSLLVANLGFEVGYGHWSLDVPVCYSPYDLFSHVRKVRILSTQPELRFWFKEFRSSHFVGVHGIVAGYNIAFPSDSNRYQDNKIPALGVGLGWGYSLPFGKDNSWGVEFNLGVGAVHHNTNIFNNVYNGLQTGNKTGWYFGPTRAGISIYYNFNLQ